MAGYQHLEDAPQFSAQSPLERMGVAENCVYPTAPLRARLLAAVAVELGKSRSVGAVNEG